MPPPSVVLIVDDEPIGRSALQALLAREGYLLETAADGPTALRMATDLLPDLILLDVMMPGMDGFEVTRQLRLRAELADVPILLVTALDDKASRLAGLEAGADDFLTKPFDRVEMRARIRTITRLNRFRHLTNERERYHRLFDRSPCGLCVIDGDAHLKEANTVAQSLLSRWLGPDSPLELFRLVPDDQSARFRDLLEVARGDPTTPARAEFTAKSHSRALIWFELTVSKFPVDEGEAFQVAITDRTTERVLEEDLRQAQKLESIGQLAGGIAHDFNNLLTVINGFSTLALSQIASTDPACEMIEQVYQSGERAAALTRQLLAFSRKDITTPVILDLNALVGEVEKMLRRLIGEHLVVVTRLAPTPGLIRADPGQVEQVLFNLAVNARDAMPTGGQLLIEIQSVYEPGEEVGAPPLRWVRLTVEDTGCGIPPEIQSRIFEPYFTTKQLGKGTGLGLATVYGIVQRCEGRIKVTSEMGRGTRFTVDFPRLTDSTRGTEPAPEVFKISHGTETVLLAEDDAAVRSFAAATLTSAGYRVLTACDGEDALTQSASYPDPIHLLVTDAVMPRLGGRGLAERLVSLRPNIKVLLTSGYDDDAVIQHGFRSSDAPFLQKPYTILRFLQKIREVLDQ